MSDILAVIGVGGMGRSNRTALRSRSPSRPDFDRPLLGRVADNMTNDGYDVVPLYVEVSSHELVTDLARIVSELGDIRYIAHTAGVSGARGSEEAIVKIDLAGVAYSLEEFGKVISPAVLASTSPAWRALWSHPTSRRDRAGSNRQSR